MLHLFIEKDFDSKERKRKNICSTCTYELYVVIFLFLLIQFVANNGYCLFTLLLQSRVNSSYAGLCYLIVFFYLSMFL